MDILTGSYIIQKPKDENLKLTLSWPQGLSEGFFFQKQQAIIYKTPAPREFNIQINILYDYDYFAYIIYSRKGDAYHESQWRNIQ